MPVSSARGQAQPGQQNEIRPWWWRGSSEGERREGARRLHGNQKVKRGSSNLKSL